MINQSSARALALGIVLYPNLNLLSFTASYEVFSYLPDARVYLLAPTLDPIHSESGIRLFPNTTFAKSPNLDVLFVPGGLGINARLEDTAFLNFLETQGKHARYVTSVCTGSLLLAGAGLLQGYRATTSWSALELLAMFGVETVAERVVIDRNRITGGGVTAAIDLGLALAAKLYGEMVAQEIQLEMEYNPTPPFLGGSSQTANPLVLARVQAQGQPLFEMRRQIIQRIVGM
ncbi:DJ-1/PfpI family protein [Aliterella atlantica]|uniref:Thiamine biosynthesis protein ThiJ n=1 Tax=Aliterella atlantica CENA595 TaxID=1618023 RepID=A0A0D8ZQH5_9CYAN|nr:DJ-1/PfpI family protein [Aliterella atlantica]KJH69461.1 thiamine biosynthesis protein ThiJ [Aliterella atlantica CENA595]